MDECRFDNWTRMLGGMIDRRTALRDMTGAGVALVTLAKADLGLAADDEVLIEGCRLSGDKCDKGSQCCSGDCKGAKKKKKKKNGKKRPKKQGECRCKGEGDGCSKDSACCRGYCDKNEGRCRCTPDNSTCSKDQDCCRGTCKSDKNGNYFCKKK
ncbi:MAG: hypothetical protein QM692_16710 [Thermomicrobiales bacterium]